MKWIAVAIGAFYVFAGVVVLRRMAMDSVLDVVLEAITLEPTDPKERLKGRVLTLGGCLTFAGGLALLTLSPWATVFFAANAILQGGYLLWARKALPPESDEDQQGRNQTLNAYVIYLAAFAFVVHAHSQGVFSHWPIDIGRFSWAIEPLVISAAAGALWAKWFLRTGPKKGPASWGSGGNEDGIEPGDDMPRPPWPERLRLAPEYGCWPTWDDATGENIDPADLGLPDDLFIRLQRWDDAWQATFKPDDPANSGFGSQEADQRWRQEGEAIAGMLTQQWPGEVIVKL